MSEFVWRDGSRLTPWMLYQINLLGALFYIKFKVNLTVRSGLRTYQEQVDIFLSRYVTAPNVNGRKVYDTRVWNGARWYRVSPAGTVAVPGTSNHEVQGASGAVDFGDTGNDGQGVAVAGSVRANWLRVNAPKFDFVPEGYAFKEPWHYRASNIFKTPPVVGGGASSGGTVVMKHYHKADAAARGAGRTVAPGSGFYLNTTAGAAASQATNVVGGVGTYSLTAHVYASGTPGDVVEFFYLWQDTTVKPAVNSGHYVERAVVDKDGFIKTSVEFKRAVAAGFAVYLRLNAPVTNKGSVKVTVLDSDAYLYA